MALDVKLPDRGAAIQMGWRTQVDWREGGLPCLMRFTDPFKAEEFVEDLTDRGVTEIVVTPIRWV